MTGKRFRFLIATLPASGHVNPMLPIAAELVRQGHEVRWLTSEDFKGKIEQAGARFLKMENPPNLSVESMNRQFPGRKKLKGIALFKHDFRHRFIDSIPREVNDLKGIIQGYRPDVLLTPFIYFGSAYFAKKEGIPWAALNINPLSLPSRDTAPFGSGRPPDSTTLGRLRNSLMQWFSIRIIRRDLDQCAQGMLRKADMEPGNRPFFEMLVKDAISLYLQPTTPAFEYPRSDLPPNVHFIGPLLPGKPKEKEELPSWWDELESGKPVVLVSQGTIATDYKDLIIPSIKALADEDVLLLVTTSGNPVEKVDVDPLPSNVRVDRYLPFNELMPRLDAMITNGGYGGVQLALSYGVPLVVAGTTEDKPEVSARVEWSRAGINLKTDRPTEIQIKNAVKAILSDPGYKQKAKAIQADFSRYDAPKRAAELLEKLAETKKPVLRKD